MISRFVLGPFLQWLPSFFFLVILAIAAYWYFKNKANAKYSQLLVALIIFDLLYAYILSALTHYVWARNPLDQILLNQPLSPETPLFGLLHLLGFLRNIHGGYFIFYTFTRYWLPVLFLFATSLIFFLVLTGARKLRPETLANQELLLALITALIASWPGVIIFLPLVFIVMIIYMIFSQLAFHRQRSDLGTALLIAALVVLVSTPFLNNLLIKLRT